MYLYLRCDLIFAVYCLSGFESRLEVNTRIYGGLAVLDAYSKPWKPLVKRLVELLSLPMQSYLCVTGKSLGIPRGLIRAPGKLSVSCIDLPHQSVLETQIHGGGGDT